MKKHFVLFIALFALTFSVEAQTSTGNIAGLSTSRLANFEIQNIFSSYDRAENIGTIQLRSIQQGRNHLLTDRRTGNKLMLIAERQGTKVRVAGFMIQTKDGRYIKIGEQSVGKAKPGSDFGCPDNWDATLVCYTHPTYGVTVCYLRCTPTEITLQLPSGF